MSCSGSAGPAPQPPTACPKTTCATPRGFVDTPGGLLRVFRSGSHQQTVVFVHDWAHDSSAFAQQVSALWTRYTVVTYDLRGHGSSTDKSRKGASVADHAADLAAVIEAVAGETEPVHLVGQGLGGLIALELARRRRSRVRSVTAIGALHALPPEVKKQYRALAAGYRSDPASYVEWSGRLVPVWISRGYLNAHPGVVAVFDTMLARHDPASIAGTLEQIVDHELTVSDLSAIDAPALVLYGQDDPFPGTKETEAFFAALAHVKRLRIPGAGHEPTLENAGAVNAALARHLGGS